MSTAIALATPADADRLMDLMARYHAEAGLTHDDAHRAAVLGPLLDGSPLGAVWLIGPKSSPLGYVMVTFGWSISQGGLVGWLEECFIRASVRGRGIGTEVLHAVAVNLARADMRAMHVILPAANPDAAGRFCARAGFRAVPGARLMTDPL
ncbi:Protein N-acetyltransferase, RimJ/RimL family [Loktanella fryxellensis]|uniref:Protein N-acetyltransferase, RimJ/RimL family n=1 Tax=Loktanella fryxellensis TaxID=245187 RepID=A0A1H7YBX2_9RHOB|nr:GNAT family N-acetyltransferase [Loktanella fryxellensis]SEM43483.1 Protein N-acetyltransferase, RimJ/RimL family [Loktanella fryxellensis]